MNERMKLSARRICGRFFMRGMNLTLLKMMK